MKHYTLAMDPPWNERGGGKIKRGADRHYPLLKDNHELKFVLEGSELWPELEKDDTASLWMWATANFLYDAMRLMGMLGFEYVTNVVWVKAEMAREVWARNEMSIDCLEEVVVIPQAPGLGQRVRMCHEHLLYGRMGKVPSPPPENRMPSVIYAPRARHSAKPQEAYDVIERHEEGVLCSLLDREGSQAEHERVEFFAREPRERWLVWGNEV